MPITLKDLCRLGRDLFEKSSLYRGGHAAPPDFGEPCEQCAMELAAHLAIVCELHDDAGWTDRDDSVCPIIGTFVRSWNDGLRSNEERDRLLKPFVLRVIGTKSTPEIEIRRSWMAADWLIRTYTPAWLTLAKLTDNAAELMALPEIVDADSCNASLDALGRSSVAAQSAVVAARYAARVAARVAAAWAAAAGDAAAWDAARVAARVAAAGDAAAGAAAAGDAAAWDAVWAAAGDALSPGKETLQISAGELLTRMIEVA